MSLVREEEVKKFFFAFTVVTKALGKKMVYVVFMDLEKKTFDKVYGESSLGSPVSVWYG